jgi:hypothetical protein
MAKNKKESHGFLLLDMNTGAMDGIYASMEFMGDAPEEVIKRFNERYQGTNWVIVKIVEKSEKHLNLPDSTWHCTCSMLDGRREY